VALAPWAAGVKFRQGDERLVEPRRELAAEATRLWRAKVGTPVAYVAGTHRYAGAVMFYSADRPDQLIAFDYHLSPWVDPIDLKRRGLLAVCLADDPACLAGAAAFSSPATTRTDVRLAHTMAGRTAKPADFAVFVTPPRG
jgi:hypothetical protein